MSERKRQLEQASEKREYSFDEGFVKALATIQQLLDDQEGVVVAITGSSADVGKTFLGSALCKELVRRDIPTAVVTDLTLLNHKPWFIGSDSIGRVLILGAEGFPFGYTKREDNTPNATIDTHKRAQNMKMKQKADEFGLPFSKIDLRIFIFRPDRPFSPEILGFADLVIRNDKAIDDPYKSR